MSDQELLLADLMPNLEASQRARMCHHRQDAALCPRRVLFYASVDKGERIEDKKRKKYQDDILGKLSVYMSCISRRYGVPGGTVCKHRNPHHA